ncbi:MAG: DUF4167 domain-containing protein [Pseudomonadota bacterium]
MKRGRNQRRRQGANPNRAFDSNGPDVRIRGTANQIHDKYIALARDASSAGDRVKAENYLQHAEHYFRLIRSMQPSAAEPATQSAELDGSGEQPSVGGGKPARRPRSRPDTTSEANDDRNEDRAEAESVEVNGAAEAEDASAVTSSKASSVEPDAEPVKEAEAKPEEDAEAEEPRPRQRRKRRVRTTKADKADAEAAQEEAAAS